MTETGNRTLGASGTWHDPQALGTLRALHRAGTLATEYGRVRALLARMPATDLPAAGQLLARLDAKEVCRHADVPVVTVAVTGHSTVAPLVAPLTAELARHGMLLEAKVAPYGSYLQDLMRPATAGEEQPQLTLCLLDAHTVFDDVTVPLPRRPRPARAR